jgi:hypothetical protein
MRDLLRRFKGEFKFTGHIFHPRFENRSFRNSPKRSVDLDRIKLRPIKLKIMLRGKVVRIKLSLPFAVSIAACANIELHALLIAIQARFVYTKSMTRLLAILIISAAAIRAADAPTALDKELERFRPFLKTWKGEFVGGKNPNPMTDVSRFERALNGKAIRVMHSVNEGIYAGETIIMWDAPSKQIRTYYFTTSGDRTEGSMELGADGTITSTEIVKGEESKEGADPVTKVRAVSKILPDGRLHVKSEYLKKAGWVAGHEILYKETPGAEVVFK